MEELVGLFFVWKSDGEALRLIIDARRANARFEKAPRTSLPSAAAVGDVWVDSPKPLGMTAADIKEFFYRLGLPRSIRRFFCLHPVDPRKLTHPSAREHVEAGLTQVWPRLAVVPMVLEARGLDVTPAMIGRLTAAGDLESARVLETIYTEEQEHVGAGARWFAFLCRERSIEPEATFHALVRRHFRGALKPPFNTEARLAAGLPPRFYEPLAAPSG